MRYRSHKEAMMMGASAFAGGNDVQLQSTVGES